MFGFSIKNNLGQISFDAARGQMLQFVGKYLMYPTAESSCTSYTFQCLGFPLVFVKNTTTAGGSMMLTGMRNISGNTWEVSAIGNTVTPNGSLTGEAYVFGLKTANYPMDQYGFVIKNSTPGGLDFFDARDRILKVECVARSTDFQGTLPGPAIAVTGGVIPVDWAVCASFPVGELIQQVNSNTALGYFTTVSRIDANNCSFMGPSQSATGGVYPVTLRGRCSSSSGFSAYFIDASLYQ